MASTDKLQSTADKLKRTVERNVDSDKLKDKFDLSSLDINAVIRGMQLTLVGAHRALQNPELFTSEHYKQAAAAVVAGLAIRLIVAIPIVGVRVLLWFISLFYSLEEVTWDDNIVEGLNFIGEYVLQVPFFLMTLMRYIVPTLDNLSVSTSSLPA
jgi:fructose-specific component phosphotransferase system IIB-like protein